MSSEYPDLFNEATELFDNGRYDDAISLYEKIISKDEKQSEVWYNMGLAYYEKGNLEKAIYCYDKATKINENYPSAWYNMGLSYYNKGLPNGDKEDYNKAVFCYDKALSFDINPKYFVNKGLAQEALDQKENALQSYEGSIKNFPNYSLGWYNKGLVLFFLRRFEESKTSFEKVIELEPNNDDAWYYLGVSYSRLNESSKAYKCFMQALKLDPREKSTYQQIGLSFESLGMKREAAYYYNLFRNIENEILDFTITKTSHGIIPDLWISSDKLGYDIYANTIANLLFNLIETPLAISIQAPWGAGKTSLMRIVQEKIDIDSSEAYKGKISKDLTYQKLKDLKKLLKVIISNSKLESRTDSYDTSHEEQIVILEKKADAEQRKKFISVWFDPWEYENTEQLWAGLADSMIRGVINRMSPSRRDLFLLQLNLRIYNFKDLLGWIRSYVLSQTWKKFRPWIFVTMGGLIASALTALAGTISVDPHLYGGGIAGLAITVIQAGINFFRNNTEIENLTSTFTLNDYLKVPDYTAKQGKTHEAMEDIRRIIKAIPNEFKPLIIFVDDLDRCSPNNIAKLFEGINQFVSSNFKDCIFIIGMDNQVVVSALEVIYKDIIEKLPEYLLQLQLGWRYLEKFIQLPILIPPTDKDKLRKYIAGLLNKEVETAIGSKNDNFKIPFQRNENPTNGQTDVVNGEIEKLSYAAYIFSINPRDVKRFLNLVTYYSNLRSEIIRRLPSSQLPTYDQIRRWIILILKWPSLAQWLYWTQDPLSYSISSDVLTSPSFRLKQLETLALESKNLEEWQQKLSIEFDFEKPKSISWIADPNVREFFRDEKNQKAGSKLSDGAGLGIY